VLIVQVLAVAATEPCRTILKMKLKAVVLTVDGNLEKAEKDQLVKLICAKKEELILAIQ
jgi:hypothetical protein